MIAVVADTHLPRGKRVLPNRCRELLEEAELIVHAGDWSEIGVLEMFAAIGPPVVGVHGNVEDSAIRTRLPERAEFLAGDHIVGVTHDAGPKRGRLERMRREFPAADAVIFGHSHIPLIEVDRESGFQIFNPGSPTERRRAPTRSMGILEVAPDERLRFQHVDLMIAVCSPKPRSDVNVFLRKLDP